MEIQKRCKYCGGTFIAHKMTTIYCSPSCNNKDYKRKIREKQIAEYQESHPDTPPLIVRSPFTSKDFLTPTECAKLLGMSRATFYRNLRDGTVKAVQMRGKTIVRRIDIEHLFDNPPEYKTRSLDPKTKQKREYYTMRQIEEPLSQYEAKYKGRSLTEEQLGFHKVAPLPYNRVPYLIDNVVDTGNTAKAAVKALGGGIVLSYAMSDTLLERNQDFSQSIRR